jgi:hypothetical protein
VRMKATGPIRGCFQGVAMRDCVPLPEVLTDVAGSFKLDGLPRDCTFAVIVTKPGWSPTIVFARAGEARIRVEVVGERVVTGRVLAHNGEPLGGVEIVSTFPGGAFESRTLSDRGGRYRLRLVSGVPIRDRQSRFVDGTQVQASEKRSEYSYLKANAAGGRVACMKMRVSKEASRYNWSPVIRQSGATVRGHVVQSQQREPLLAKVSFDQFDVGAGVFRKVTRFTVLDDDGKFKVAGIFARFVEIELLARGGDGPCYYTGEHAVDGREIPIVVPKVGFGAIAVLFAPGNPSASAVERRLFLRDPHDNSWSSLCIPQAGGRVTVEGLRPGIYRLALRVVGGPALMPLGKAEVISGTVREFGYVQGSESGKVRLRVMSKGSQFCESLDLGGMSLVADTANGRVAVPLRCAGGAEVIVSLPPGLYSLRPSGTSAFEYRLIGNRETIEIRAGMMSEAKALRSTAARVTCQIKMQKSESMVPPSYRLVAGGRVIASGIAREVMRSHDSDMWIIRDGRLSQRFDRIEIGRGALVEISAGFSELSAYGIYLVREN